MTTLTYDWTSQRTRTSRAEVETEDCIIEVILKFTTSTPKSITRRVKGGRRYFSATTGTPALEMYSLEISDSPETEPLRVAFSTLMPLKTIEHWLVSHGLGKHYKAVVKAAFDLQAKLAAPQPK